MDKKYCCSGCLRLRTDKNLKAAIKWLTMLPNGAGYRCQNLKLAVIHLLLLGMLMICACQREAVLGSVTTLKENTYANPVIGTIGLADPHVILYEGKYYLYPTGDADRGYRVYTSTDLVNWQRGTQVFWAEDGGVWAPDVYYHPEDNKFYLYYTVNKSVGVAVSESPLGPFEKHSQLFGPQTIDAHMFRDDDGRLYLYYVTMGRPFRICVQPMADPVTMQGNAAELIWPTEPWEKDNVTEGPWMLKKDDLYYLMYSGSGANSRDYAVGYAVSDKPTGAFRKYQGNPIVHSDDSVYGPGHHCVVKDQRGELWMVYHQKNGPSPAWDRFICIDRLWFDQQGDIHGKATRGTLQQAPAPVLQNLAPDH